MSSYTLHLELTLNGPDFDWEDVADAVVNRIHGQRIAVKPFEKGVTVVRVVVDTADDDEAEA